MKKFVYPASFSPPTYGHLSTVRKAAEVTPSLTLVCSINPDKKNWFSEDERAALWSTYVLPENVRVRTFSGMAAEGNRDFRNLVMVRGIRNEVDYEYEKKVAFMNRKDFGLDSFLYFMADQGTSYISSTVARNRAAELDFAGVSECVSPLVVSVLLERVLDLNRLFLVVGRPGGGKSTFARMMGEVDSRNHHINTDFFVNDLRSLIVEKFGDADPVSLVLEREEELKEVIAQPWLECLRRSLRSAPKGSNVFLEIPYAFQSDKELFRGVGGRVIYVGSQDDDENRRRVIARGTPHIAPMIERIPGLEETRRISVENRLQFTHIDSDCPISDLQEKARELNGAIDKKEGLQWMMPSCESF